MSNFRYTSSLDELFRDELEALLFFNPQQTYVRSGIIEAVEKYGTPQVVTEQGTVRVALPPSEGVQSIFALDINNDGTERLAGAALFVRESRENIVLLHIAVSEDYAMEGPHADSMLVMRLITQVKSIALRLKGVETITIIYGEGIARKIPVH